MAYDVVSLFSGAGFLDIGFVENGFNIIWGCEIVPEFAAVHNYNMRKRFNYDSVVVPGDITKISSKVIPKSVGIIGGPPCQDFSTGNANGEGVKGKRGKLVWDYLKKLRQLKPDFFLFENVEALYKTKKHREEALIPLLKHFDRIGYEVDFRVLNALEYGIPQDRARVFIIGFKKSIIRELKRNGHPGFIWPEKKYENPKKSFEWPDTWVFGTEIDEESYIKELPYPYELTVHSVIGNEEELKELPNHVAFNAYSTKIWTVEEGDDHRKSFKRLHRFRYSPTVAYGNNEVHLHPKLPRRLTVREALRIQTVPDWYEFPEDMPLSEMFKMVSNGVPTKLASKLAIQIKAVLDSYYGNQLEPKKENIVTVVR